MQKNKTKTLISILLILAVLLPVGILHANEAPYFEDGSNSGTDSGNGSNGSQPTNITAKLDLYVDTMEATNITFTTATLNGVGGYRLTTNATQGDIGAWYTIDGGKSGYWATGTDRGTWVTTSSAGGTAGVGVAKWVGTKGDGTGTWSNSSGLVSGTWENDKGSGGVGSGIWISNTRTEQISTNVSPVTAYFRYSKAKISPIYCNDIYGTNMYATNDINLGKVGASSFYQKITGLTPDTTYYYCAIVSNKDDIAYGGQSIVKSFHTSPYGMRITTKPATSVKTNSATLNGAFSSANNLITYFQYRKYSTTTPGDWVRINSCAKTHKLETGKNNINDSVSCDLSGLSTGTRYQFRTVAQAASGSSSNLESKIIYGTILNFVTSSSSTGTDGGGDNGTGGGSSPINDPYSPYSPYNPYGPGSDGNPYNPYNPYNPNTCTNGATNYPACNADDNNQTCFYGGTYPDCDTSPYTPFPPYSPGDGTGTNGGGSGTWTTGTAAGTWTATSGTGGTGAATWTTTGAGYGTWTSPTGSGTWILVSGKSGASSGSWSSGTTTGGINAWGARYTNGNITNAYPLNLGQSAIPPSDAIVHYHEGVETVFTRQIVADINFARLYGYQDGANLQTFAEDLAHLFAKTFGYIDANGKEIRVSPPDIAAYQLALIGNRLTIYEYYDNKIIDVRNADATFKSASNYEYYYKK